jgi:DNA-binding transcriptional ArsR family regulator
MRNGRVQVRVLGAECGVRAGVTAVSDGASRSVSEEAGGLLPVQVVALPSQLKAFAHPTRVRLLEMLIEQPMTVKQLGDAMDMTAARAHYHLKFLERAGLVRLVERREKAGVVEKYYRAASRKFVVGGSIGTFGEPGAVILESLSAALLSGAMAAARGAPIGLIAGANERVTVPAGAVERLLGVANTLQAAQDELRDLHAAGGGQGEEPGGEMAFELTYALYATGRKRDTGGDGCDTGDGGGSDSDDCSESESGERC